MQDETIKQIVAMFLLGIIAIVFGLNGQTEFAVIAGMLATLSGPSPVNVTTQMFSNLITQLMGAKKQ